MNKYFRLSLDFILFSNVFIALCAVAQGLLTYRLLGVTANKFVLGLLLCSTLAMYNYSILLSKPSEPKQSPFRRVQWVFSHYRLTITLTIIAVLAIIPLAFFISTSSKILLLFLALISITYNLPIFSIDNKKFGLRNIPGIKLFLIALVWSFSCVLLPIIELESQQIFIPLKDTTVLLAKRFLFIAAITVPFDIRDLFQDKKHELKTIPVAFGEKKAYWFCFGLLFLYLTLLLLFTSSVNASFISLTVTTLLAGWLIFKSNWEKNEYYYFLYLDGLMIVQYMVVALVA